MKPVSARFPVSAISRSSPTRSSISAHSAAGALVVPEDRRPQHAVGARRARRGRASGRRGRSRRRSSRRRAAASAASLARHQSSGSCSAQPGRGVESRYVALGPGERRRRSGESASAFTPVVPTSSPTRRVTRRRPCSPPDGRPPADPIGVESRPWRCSGSRQGLWRWTGHPDWTPRTAARTGWEQEVGVRLRGDAGRGRPHRPARARRRTRSGSGRRSIVTSSGSDGRSCVLVTVELARAQRRGRRATARSHVIRTRCGMSPAARPGDPGQSRGRRPLPETLRARRGERLLLDVVATRRSATGDAAPVRLPTRPRLARPARAADPRGRRATVRTSRSRRDLAASDSRADPRVAFACGDADARARREPRATLRACHASSTRLRARLHQL